MDGDTAERCYGLRPDSTGGQREGRVPHNPATWYLTGEGIMAPRGQRAKISAEQLAKAAGKKPVGEGVSGGRGPGVWVSCAVGSREVGVPLTAIWGRASLSLAWRSVWCAVQ